MQSIFEYTSTQGCESSRADAKHDFHGIFKADKVQEYVNENIPLYGATGATGATDCVTLTEDAFVDKYEIKPGKSSAEDKSDDFIVNNLNENVLARYQAYNVVRPQHDFTVTTSLIQECFQKAGIVNDVFFICDVAYANVREDLKYADERSTQTFYWVQNAQTLYDPAGKTTWHSDNPYFEKDANDDIETGASSPSSPSSPSSESGKREMCPNYFKKEGSKFLFCWQNAKKNIVTLYPEWSKTLFPNPDSSYKFSENIPEQMMYTNKNLFLSIRTENVNDYASQEANLIITDSSKPGYYGYADKVLSAKGTGVLDASELASYRAKGNELKRFVKFINDSIKNPSTTKLFLDEVMNYSSYFQVLAKKVGDASQSISCCQKQMNLQKFKNNVTGAKTVENIEDFDSNGNHAFVTFDRIAIACALNFNCPIVIGNTQRAFTIYIRKDLINIHKQFTIFFNKDGDNFIILNQLKNKELTSFVLNSALFSEINLLKENVKKSIEQACYNLNITPVDDITYQNFLINYFIELNVFQIFSNIETSVLQSEELNYANKIKKIYTDSLALIIEDSKKFGVNLSVGLVDISALTNVQQILTAINTNINKIFDALKTKYDSLEVADKENYDPKTNPNHETFVSIINVLKLAEKIILDIGEIQKLLLTNIDSMEKLIAYQLQINNDNDNTKLNETNVKNLPKGIATNITSYTPFTYYVTNSRTVRNSDVFFERSTSIFGTTTVILQIFNILNCNKLNKLKERFTKIIYNLLDDLTGKATAFSNISFISIINAAKTQLEKLLIINTSVVAINPITSDNINDVIDLNVFITSTAPATEPEASITAAEAPVLSRMRTTFKNKKLFISKPVSSENKMTFKERVEMVRESNETLREIFNDVQTGFVTASGINETIQIAYENEIFIKGFIGLFTFMKYIYISSDGKTRIPTLFKSDATGSQDNVLGRLFELLYLNLDDGKQDINLMQKIQEIKTDIQNKMPGFNFDQYNSLTNNEAKLRYIENSEGVKTKTQKKIIAENFENYIKYCKKIEEFFDLNEIIDDTDNNPPIYKSDFTVNSFRSLLEMNVVTVGGDMKLEDFDNINVNEINANVALLYFIENRIATMNDKPIPHPELIGLFSQLFKGSGILSQEYIKKSSIIADGQAGGVGDDLFDTMFGLFAAQDSTEFNQYRQNSYLLLNMPNNYEISMNNFQSYPSTIRTYLQSLNKESQQEKKREEQMTKLKNIDLGRGAIQPFYKENIPQPQPFNQNLQQPLTAVSGGKTKKYRNKKNKTNKKSKTSKRNKTLKNKRSKKNKTIKK
jgi:hypothetical protein